MKLSIKSMMFATMAFSAVAANAVVFTDATGDFGAPMNTYGNPNFDVSSLEITNDLTNIVFKFTVNNANITSPDWHKFFVLLNDGTGPTSGSNGWGRNIALAGGATAWMGGWVDGGGGGQGFTYNGAWNNNNGVTIALSGSTATYTASLSSLGLSIGDTFTFDAGTTGNNGDHGAWDLVSLATPSAAGPTDFVTSNSNLQYSVVPEPATMTAMAMGAAALLRRRKKA